MTYDVVLILLIAVVPIVLQVMALNIFVQRMGRALRKAGDRPPFTTEVKISALGPHSRAITKLLDRATRLDADEIDAVIAARGGTLPLPMSHRAAHQLVRELRQLGAQAEAHYRFPDPGVA
jgi:hypothetical protein